MYSVMLHNSHNVNHLASSPLSNEHQVMDLSASKPSGPLRKRRVPSTSDEDRSLIGLLGNPKKRRIVVPVSSDVSSDSKSLPQGGGSWWKFGAIQKDMINELLAETCDDYDLRSMVEDLTPRPFGPVKIQNPDPAKSALETLVVHRMGTSSLSHMLSMGLQEPSIPQENPMSSLAPTTTDMALDDDLSSDGSGVMLKFRAYQAENWSEKFDELIEFRKKYGHCLVPNSFHDNPTLAQWVKRQRYQYKLKQEGKRSTVSDERVAALEDIGFVWDSHKVVWDERLNELLEYKRTKGNCNVPSRYSENRQLAVWVKRQRRQYKFYCGSKPSSMTQGRIARLEAIGFEWDLRSKE